MSDPFALYFSSTDVVATLKRYDEQLNFFHQQMMSMPVTAIFFGRTSRKKLSPDFLTLTLKTIEKYFEIDRRAQITAEVFAAEQDDYTAFVKAGATRLSLKDYAIEACEKLAQSAKTYNVDLVYGMQDQTVPMWRAELEKVVTHDPPHISVEEHDDIKRYQSSVMFYEVARDMLLAKGYVQTDLMHYAKPGHQSAYVDAYLDLYPYLGVGPDAVGLYRNVKGDWILSQTADEEIWAKEPASVSTQLSKLSNSEFLSFILEQGLKTPRGIQLKRLKELMGRSYNDILSKNAIHDLIEAKLITVDNSTIRPTTEGLLKTNSVVDYLIKSASVPDHVP